MMDKCLIFEDPLVEIEFKENLTRQLVLIFALVGLFIITTSAVFHAIMNRRMNKKI